jgi:ribosomal protein S18 acetylase RimI-like enzyme
MEGARLEGTDTAGRVERASADYLASVTRLLERCRLADPTGGLWEAADFQWWWRRVRPSDELGQIFWIDDHGDPVAAFVLTDWDGRWEGEVTVAPDRSRELFAEVWQQGLERMASLELETVHVRARDDDTALRRVLAEAGFAPAGDESTASWLDGPRRSPVSELPRGFRLRSHAERADRPHHMIRRNGEEVAERLGQCSLYDPELDLLVEAPNGEVAGYALFWADPVTRVGLVEPMRAEDAYQRLGIGKHLLTAGVDRLASRGCERMKVSYRDENAGAKALYLGAGFSPNDTSRVYCRGFAGGD